METVVIKENDPKEILFIIKVKKAFNKFIKHDELSEKIKCRQDEINNLQIWLNNLQTSFNELQTSFNESQVKLAQQNTIINTLTLDNVVQNTMTSSIFMNLFYPNKEKKTFIGFNTFSPEHSVIRELENIQKFYFIPNHGNLGDVVIAEAEYQLFKQYRIKYEILDIFDQNFIVPEDKFNLVYGGGGIFVKYWNYQHILDIFKSKNLQKCIILPSSFYECNDLLEALDERFVVFCREEKSYNYCKSINRKSKFIMANDMAFSLSTDNFYNYDEQICKEKSDALKNSEIVTISSEIIPSIVYTRNRIVDELNRKTVILQNGVRIGYFLRNDIEKNIDEAFEHSIDLSAITNSSCTDPAAVKLLSGLFIEAVNSVDVVLTDRLHIGICAALTGKEVYLFDNSYGKVSGVYKYSLKNLENVCLLDKYSDFDVTKIKIQNSTANLQILQSNCNVLDYFKIYLYNLTSAEKRNNTVWIKD